MSDRRAKSQRSGNGSARRIAEGVAAALVVGAGSLAIQLATDLSVAWVVLLSSYLLLVAGAGAVRIRRKRAMPGRAYVGLAFAAAVVTIPVLVIELPKYTLEVSLFNIDDKEEVLVDGDERGRGGFNTEPRIKLKGIKESDRITLRARNSTAGYTWGFIVVNDGDEIFRDVAGDAGKEGGGVNKNDQSNFGLVHSVTINGEGYVLGCYTVGWTLARCVRELRMQGNTVTPNASEMR